MIVDPKKVNLLESDIEEYLWANPQTIAFEGSRVVSWIKRQYAVPSGIIDLFGMTAEGHYVVVEVKNVDIDSKAVAQVCRYAFDLEEIIMKVSERSGIYYPYPIFKVLVGPDIGDNPLRECEGCNVQFVRFTVRFELTLSSYGWTEKFKEQRDQAYEQLAVDDDLFASHAFFVSKQKERARHLSQSEQNNDEGGEGNGEDGAEGNDDNNPGFIPF